MPSLEKAIGIEVYATKTTGIGGSIRKNAEDFVVREVLVDGSEAKAGCPESHEVVLGSSARRTAFLLCVLTKRNWDTLAVLRKIVTQLGIGSDRIHIAGIKDAKAYTSQYLAVEGVVPEEVCNVSLKDMEIHPIGYVRNRLTSYYLLGNRFEITITSLKSSESSVRCSISKTIDETDTMGGIPNYFGHQRFGTIRPITHLVGKAIIEGHFEEAAMLFLAESFPNEHDESREARAELGSTLNFREAFERFPEQLRYERIMLKHLCSHAEDFKGAFRALPLKLQELFLQGYQSYIFNRFLSKRLQNGIPLNHAEVGDYVVNVERTGLPLLTMRKTAGPGMTKEINVLIRKGKMRIAIPLIGSAQHLSKGIQGEFERQILEDENISLEEFGSCPLPTINVRGGLRGANSPVTDFQVSTVEESGGLERRALIRFMLQRGSYATVLLREIMKPRDIIGSGF